MRNLYITIALLCAVLAGCSGTGKTATAASTGNDTTSTAAIDAASLGISGDSALAYVQAQCDFGARVPGTAAHRQCGDWLKGKLQSCCPQVSEQNAEVTAFDGTRLRLRNLIAEYNPEAERRILLMAHWDCRPWADSDPDEANRTKPVMGANDGASGCAVILEIARALHRQAPSVGVDILLTDAEDWGDDSDGGGEDTWALGTQYWCRHMHRTGYHPLFGILLDMVGHPQATFRQEYYSLQYAPGAVRQVWQTAAALGHGDLFSNEQGGAITDDHVFVCRAGVPCIDIIDNRPDSPTGFCPQWHTADDTPRHISAATLQATAETVLAVIRGY